MQIKRVDGRVRALYCANEKVVTKGAIMCQLKGWMDKGGYDNVQMKGGWIK